MYKQSVHVICLFEKRKADITEKRREMKQIEEDWLLSGMCWCRFVLGYRPCSSIPLFYNGDKLSSHCPRVS